MVPRVVRGLGGMSLKGKAKAFGMGFEEEEDPVRSFSLFFSPFFCFDGGER